MLKLLDVPYCTCHITKPKFRRPILQLKLFSKFFFINNQSSLVNDYKTVTAYMTIVCLLFLNAGFYTLVTFITHNSYTPQIPDKVTSNSH